jgi:glycyl-tRNA synthetase beta chain
MTPHAASLLIEVFTEELPPKALARLGHSFSSSIQQQLQEFGLIASGSEPASFASPRRLAVRLADVAEEAPERKLEVKGPSMKVGLDGQGQPTQALIKWAEKQGAALDQLQRISDGKQEVFVARVKHPGAKLAAVIQAVIEKALAQLPIPKMMRYQLADGVTTVSFVRPAHSLIVLHGAKVMDCEILGLRSGRSTLGHRFQSEGSIEITDASTYEHQLLDARVIASFAERREKIATALNQAASQHQATLGDEATVDSLLDEVTALVEWPAVYVGQFETHFLEVPQECLILTMRTNQKYFPLFANDGSLLAQFLLVSNMQVDDPKLIIDGNQRVVRPRLADAKFFFEQDRKTPLADRVSQLDKVVYHAKLGTQLARSKRVGAIASVLSTMTQQSLNSSDPADLQRAAQLAKADLLSNMVGEFPELQGIMGRYYAKHDGESEAVAQAIAEHYQPRFAGDALPASDTGVLLALADKLETLCGLFLIGQTPTGDKDPFALRRHALGVLRMLIERKLSVPWRAMIERSMNQFEGYEAQVEQASGKLAEFMLDRLAGMQREANHPALAVQSVLQDPPALLFEVPQRLQAVREFQLLPQSVNLAAANKRIQNILRKNGQLDSRLATPSIDASLLIEPAEKQLAQWLDQNAQACRLAVEQGRYSESLALLAQSSAAVDAFFEQVMVMAPEEELRNNRIALLVNLHQVMNQVADLSTLSA